jgi:hypothetical protein
VKKKSKLILPLAFSQAFFPLYFHKDYVRSDALYLLIRDNVFLVPPQNSKHFAGTGDD